MLTTRLSSKGQVVLPKAVREHQHWDAGVTLFIEETEEGVLLRPGTSTKKLAWKNVIGCLPYQGKPKSLKQIENAIALGIKKRFKK